MKLLLFILMTVSAGAADAVTKLTDFELTDQDAKVRSYRFPKSKVSVMTVADHKGSDQLAPWIEAVYERYEKRIDIDGVADVSMIPSAFHGMFRRAFKKQLSYSVMLDWEGGVVKQFRYRPGVANVYVIDRAGYVVEHVTGPLGKTSLSALVNKIDPLLARER